jgi:calcineurin-like phosphoesterase family protein
MIYYTSDHHWGHQAVIRMSNRPFEHVHEMNMYMIDKWNEVVNEDDEVYYLGDFMYKMNPNTFVTNVLNNLNGKIYLIIGNHDRRYLNKYMDRLEWAQPYHEMKYMHENKEYYFKLFHYPIYSWDGMWRGSIHLHGHTHYNTDDLYFESIGNKLNVNCEFFDYKPISIVEVINMFKDKEIRKS